MSNQDWNVPTGGVSAPQVPAPNPSKQSAPAASTIPVRLRAAEGERHKRFANALVDRDLLLEAAAEIERLEGIYLSAVNGRREMRAGLREARATTAKTASGSPTALYVGTMNDGVFIIDQPPSPAPDDTGSWLREGGPNVIAKMAGNDIAALAMAQALVTVWNRAALARAQSEG